MKRCAPFLFLIIMAACTAATAQKLTVVVGAVGEEPKPGLRKALETQIKAAFVKDGRYTAVTREEAVLGAVDSEQAHQRTGAVDDNQIKQIGKQTGARYVCVVEIAPLMNSYTLNAQFVDIVSANIVSIASVPNQLRNPGDFLTASEELVRKLLGYEAAPAAAKKEPMKHIAVIETQVDTLSIASSDISGADLREITSVLRREAIKNLPRNRFNIITSETVQSMGTATAEDCAGETCIITLGSKIGADYIVRGTLSKLRGRFSLTIEIFETEYGSLMAVTPDPIRTSDLDELIDKSAAGSAAMYKSFAGTGARPQPAPQPAAPAAAPVPAAKPTPTPPVTYTLTVYLSHAAAGKIERAPSQPRYDAGTKVTVKAKPEAGYRFTGWSGASSSKNDSVTITIDRDLALTANFVQQYALIIHVFPKESGKAEKGPNRQRYDIGTKVSVKATPETGYQFSGWTGATTSTRDSVTITMNRDKTLTANFKAIPTPKPENPAPEPKVKTPKPPKPETPKTLSAGGGGLFIGGFGGGVNYNDNAQLTMPYAAGGAYIFFDAIYAAATINLSAGGGKWNHSNSNPQYEPDMGRSAISIGAYGKTPGAPFLTAGLEYEINVSGKLKYDNGREIIFDGGYENLGTGIGGYDRPEANALNTLWFKFGAGYDYNINDAVYIRPTILYGIRTANDLEKQWTESSSDKRKTKLGHGVTVQIGAGWRL